MADYITRDAIENVPLNTPIPFLDNHPCTMGFVVHNSGNGTFTLRGIPNNCCSNYAQYVVEFTGNIAVPTTGTVTPIATAIQISGESMQGSRSIFTPAAVDEYGNVTSRTTVVVPRGCCFNMTVDYVSGVTDGTTTPATSINVIDGSLSITKTA